MSIRSLATLVSLLIGPFFDLCSKGNYYIKTCLDGGRQPSEDRYSIQLGYWSVNSAAISFAAPGQALKTHAWRNWRRMCVQGAIQARGEGSLVDPQPAARLCCRCVDSGWYLAHVRCACGAGPGQQGSEAEEAAVHLAAQRDEV